MLDYILNYLKTFEEPSGKIERQYKLKTKVQGCVVQRKGIKINKTAIKNKSH